MRGTAHYFTGLTFLALALFSGGAFGQLQAVTEDHPLRSLGDAFPVATGEGAVLAGAGVTFQRQSADRAFFPIDVQYGILPHTQLDVGTELSSDPHLDRGSGDLSAGVRFNFGEETRFVPSFAARLGVTAPTGVGSRAFDVQAKGYATRELARTLFLHLNAAIDVLDRTGEDQRRVRYSLAIGPSWIVPHLATLTLAGAVFAQQGERHGDPTTVGIEAGFRRRITANLYWDAGVGSELAGVRDRSAFFVHTGLSFGFGPFGPRR